MLEFLFYILIALVIVVISPLVFRSTTRFIGRWLGNIHDLRTGRGVPLGLTDGKTTIVGNLPLPDERECIRYDQMNQAERMAAGFFKVGTREYNALLGRIEKHND